MMAAMDDKPKRRWFRFRLSTVLILTAILAWAMATRPFFVLVATENGRYVVFDPHSSATLKEGRSLYPDTTPMVYDWINPRLKWPALAFAAFLAWKAAWAVVERRRRQCAASE